MKDKSAHKIKKTIAIDEKSLNILKHWEKKLRESLKDDNARLISSIFEKSLIYFYNTITERKEPNNDATVKRQTVYISKNSNSKYNELAFKYNYSLTELSNLIIRNSMLLY